MAVYIPPEYRYSTVASGVAAANNFLTITNPVSSGVWFELKTVRVRSNAVGAVSGAPPMTLSRASAVSGGTLVTNSTGVTKFITTFPDSAMQIRTGNPTATAGTVFCQFLSIESTGAGSAAGTELNIDVANFILMEGESLLFATATGDTDQRWLLSMTWKEIGV